VPTFCRHNRLTANCPICSREQNLAMRPLVSGGSASAPVREPKPERAGEPRTRAKTARPGATRVVRERANAVKVRKLARGADDGFASPLLPGLRSSEDAERLVEEYAFAVVRLEAMQNPTGIWAEIADGAKDIEERSSLALRAALTGDRGVGDESSVEAVTAAYEAWVARAGSQQAALTGEPSWTPERRFERIFERLAFKGFTRDARFEMLVLLGHLGVYELRAGSLQLAGENEATWAAKRAMGIADPTLLERRVGDFAAACDAPLDALDLALHNWGSGHRLGAGIDPETPGDEQVLAAGRDALGI
jgi:hypothetical protein